MKYVDKKWTSSGLFWSHCLNVADNGEEINCKSNKEFVKWTLVYQKVTTWQKYQRSSAIQAGQMCDDRIRIGGTVMKSHIIKSFDSKEENGVFVIT